MQQPLMSLLVSRKGRFRLESGHHGNLWLDLELLCLRPARVKQFASELAQRIAKQNVEAVCGPLNEGAFVALMVASELNALFSYAEPVAQPQTNALYPVKYRIPPALRGQVRGKRVAIVNDIINAGSAVRGTFLDLQGCGAVPVVIAALLVLDLLPEPSLRKQSDLGEPCHASQCSLDPIRMPALCCWRGAG